MYNEYAYVCARVYECIYIYMLTPAHTSTVISGVATVENNTQTTAVQKETLRQS